MEHSCDGDPDQEAIDEEEVRDSEPHEHTAVEVDVGPAGLEHIECVEVRVVHLVALEGAAESEEGIAAHGPAVMAGVPRSKLVIVIQHVTLLSFAHLQLLDQHHLHLLLGQVTTVELAAVGDQKGQVDTEDEDHHEVGEHATHKELEHEAQGPLHADRHKL